MEHLGRLLEGRWEYGWDWEQDRAYVVIRLPRGREHGVCGLLCEVWEEYVIYEGTQEWEALHELKYRRVLR